MKASEAREASTAVVQRKEEERAIRNEKEKAARIRQKEVRRKKFYADLLKSVDEDIKFEVEAGHASTEIWLGGRHDRDDDAQAEIDKSEFPEELQKVLSKLRRDGYTVTTGVAADEHWTDHEGSVPDRSWYTYHAYIKVSWK